MQADAQYMRQTLEMVKTLKTGRVAFVPMPALDQDDLLWLLRVAEERIDKIDTAERGEG